LILISTDSLGKRVNISEDTAAAAVETILVILIVVIPIYVVSVRKPHTNFRGASAVVFAIGASSESAARGGRREDFLRNRNWKKPRKLSHPNVEIMVTLAESKTTQEVL
jgi:hypothetical protein